MGYRHYVGYISKKDLPEIMKEVERLKSLIGTPKKDDEDDKYSQYDITSYLRDKSTTILELGKLYWKNTESIVNVLYDNKGEDYSNEDTEFFIVNDNKLLLHLSYAMQKIWTNYIGEFKAALDKVINKGKEELTEEDKINLKELRAGIDEEERYYKTAIKNEPGGWNFPAYNNWQFNYESCRVYNLHQDFDYTDKIMVVYAF